MPAQNLFAQYLRPVKSVADYTADMDQQDYRRAQMENAQRQNALAALQFDSQQDEIAQKRRMQNALQAVYANPANSSPQALESALMRDPLTAERGMQAQKARLDNAKAETDIAEGKARAGKAQGETMDGAIKRYRSGLDFIDTPQGAARWLAAQYNDPTLAQHMQSFGPLEEAVKEIPANPQEFADWRRRNALGMETFIKSQQEQAKIAETVRDNDRTFKLKASNELIGLDGRPNQTLIGAKQGIARAGASSVSINTGQKGLDNEFKLRGEFKQEPVYKAHQEMQSAYAQIRQSLQQQSPAGDLAGATKIMKLLDPNSVVRESELGMAMAATGLLDRVLNYADTVLKGTKLTPKQRADFQNLADKLIAESNSAFNSKRSEYERLGSDYGLNAGRALGPAAETPKPAGAAPSSVLRFDANGNPIK